MNNRPDKVFSICVPTFNRGAKALNVANTLLAELDPDWELLFIDNASDNELDSYQQIDALAEADGRIRYIRHDSNRRFHGNYLACFDLAEAPYIMIVSDEDFANIAMIKDVLPLLHAYPNVGIMRGSMVPVDGVKPANSYARADISFIAGEEALMGFSFVNNYVSGTIYNRELLIDTGIVERLRNQIDRHQGYPHLYFELLASAVTDVVSTSLISCFEGASQICSDGDPYNYLTSYSFGSRVDQFVMLRNGIQEAVGLLGEPFDKALFAAIYLRLCEKYMYLITKVNSPLYLMNKIHPGLLLHAMLYFCGAAISMHSEVSEFETTLFEEIKKLHAKYEPYI